LFDFVGKRRWFFTISGIIILIGLVSMIYSTIAFGSPVKLGIDFSSGWTMTVRFEQQVEQGALREEMASLGYGDAVIQRVIDEESTFLIRTGVLTTAERAQVEEALGAQFGDFDVRDSALADETISGETTNVAIIAVVVASIGILLYITWAFRRLMKSFRFGLCALVALLHDVLITLGIFSLLGVFFAIEIDAMFITGILTVIGYSVNDSIVVFDRVRENMSKRTGSPLETIVNNSITETIPRSLNTSLTTLFVLLALFLFGGATIHNFILVLLIGVITGTYSSICIASQLLIVWERGGLSRFFRPFRRILPRRAPVGA